MNKNTIISIGHNYEPAHFLRNNNLRYEAFPFDWNVTPLSAIIRIIENNFNNIFNYDNFIFSYKTSSLLENNNTKTLTPFKEVVVTFDKKYEIFYPHDFHKTDEDT